MNNVWFIDQDTMEKVSSLSIESCDESSRLCKSVFIFNQIRNFKQFNIDLSTVASRFGIISHFVLSWISCFSFYSYQHSSFRRCKVGELDEFCFRSIESSFVLSSSYCLLQSLWTMFTNGILCEWYDEKELFQSEGKILFCKYLSLAFFWSMGFLLQYLERQLFLRYRRSRLW